MEIRPVTVLGALVEVVVAANELLQLRLHVEDLILGEIVLDDGDLGSLEMGQETKLAGLQEEERPTLGVVATGCTADTVNVVARIIRRVELDDPVNSGDIETTSSNVRADQGTLCGVAELKEGVGALLLLLLAVEIKDRQVNVLQKFAVVLDRVARREENDNLLLGHLLEEREQEEETLVGIDNDVALVDALHCAVLLLLVNVDVEGSGPERYPGKILDLGCLCGGEEHSLALILGENLDNLAHFILETNLENTVGLVDNQGLEVLEDEGGVLEMIEQSTGGSNEQIDTLSELVGLSPAVCATNTHTIWRFG